ncbi:MAG: RIP metalloprotease RseP [Rhodothermaceae bacterium]
MSYFIYFLITIGILVFVHEFGHFIAARMCKIRTDVFAIGFGKRLLGWNKINGFTFGDLPDELELNGHTDYRLSLLPFGGYVKIAGMIDESFDTEFASKEPESWEFRSKNTFQKLFVISAGVIMNLILTLAIFWGMFFFKGDKIWNSTEIGSLRAESLASKAGLVTGDKIESINNVKTSNWQEVAAILSDEKTPTFSLVLNRDGSTINLDITQDMMTDKEGARMYLPAAPSAVSILKVVKDSPAEVAGIQEGDIFLSIEGNVIGTDEDARKVIKANSDSEVDVAILRGQDTLVVSAKPDMNGLLGVQLFNAYNGPFEYKTFGFFESVEKSADYMVRIVGLTGYFVKKVFAGDIEFGEAFGGPIRIAQFAAKSADSGLVDFLFFLAQLSLSLALINIFPFPALDGGHFLIILIEGIMRRELPLKMKIAVQNVGFVILLALMAFIIYSDILRAF